MAIETKVFPDADAASRFAAEAVAAAGRAAAEDRGEFELALSGGKTPWAMIGLLGEMEEMPWEAVHIFQVDERVAPPGDPDRNLNGLSEALLDRVPIPPENVHPMPVEETDLEAAAAVYADEIRAVTGPGGRLDVVHLGVGGDGHTASWPPGDPVIDATADVALSGVFNGRVRMTLTPPAVNRAGWIVWEIAGAAKAPVVALLVSGDPAIPASRVRRHDVALLADGDAAAGLTRG